MRPRKVHREVCPEEHNHKCRPCPWPALVIVTINTPDRYQVIEPEVPGNPVSVSASQTDPSKNCDQFSPSSPIPPKSIRTFVYKY